MWRGIMAAACLGLVVGCSIDEADYTTELAVAECQALERCALGLFESQYNDLDDCVNELGDDYDEVVDQLYDDCAYDDEEAASCVSRVEGLSCEEWVLGDASVACDLVYDCSE